MRLLRGLLGALLWIVAALLGLVGLVLCVTIILLPVGIPVLGLSRRLITQAVQLMLPKAMAHPIKESSKKGKKKRKEAGSAVSDLGDTVKDKGGGVGSLVSDSTKKA